MISSANTHFSRFARFCVIGVIATVFNYTLFLALYMMGHVSYLVANIVGFMGGVLIGYPLNRQWTYQVRKSSAWQIIKYWSVYGCSAVLSVVCLKMLVECFWVDPRIGNVIVIGVTTITNYLGVNLIVFNTGTKTAIN